MYVRRWVCKCEGEIAKVPVVRVIDVNIADRNIIKHSVVCVNDDGFSAGLRWAVIGAFNHQLQLPHCPLLWLAVVANIHSQRIRLEPECWPPVVAASGNQARFISWWYIMKHQPHDMILLASISNNLLIDFKQWNKVHAAVIISCQNS